MFETNGLGGGAVTSSVRPIPPTLTPTRELLTSSTYESLRCLLNVRPFHLW
jgi:hypothetical protein